LGSFLMDKLMPHQEIGAGYLAGQPEALLYWDQGVGKTPTAVVACDISQKMSIEEGAELLPILVICPAVARRNWGREFEKWQTRDRKIVVVESGKTDVTNADVIICSYDAIVRGFGPTAFSGSYDVIILDELQYCKNVKALRTRSIFGTGGARGQGLVKRGRQLWALSGTPAPNNISEIYPWLRGARPDLIRDHNGRVLSFTRFTHTFCDVEETRFGNVIRGNKKEPARELWSAMSDHVDRVRKQDVLQDLPPVRFSEVEVSGDKTAGQVRRLEETHRAEMNAVINAIRGQGSSEDALFHLTTLRRITELCKVGDTIDILTPELEDQAIKKVCVFATFIDSIEALVDGFSQFGAVTVHGQVPPKARQSAIDNFMADPDTRVFVGQITAAGTAITLHADGDCQDVLFVSADWVPSQNAQAVARVHRMGQTGSVHARFLHLANSIDESVVKTLMHKSRQLSDMVGEEGQHHAA
jgi:SWI/SNF-related matrix-associated actin-dependent regulator 1 of chromatin subfamily A